ncbi:MAG: polysaccharide deacetylase family protein [Hyphomicrobiaceae bacterium]
MPIAGAVLAAATIAVSPAVLAEMAERASPGEACAAHDGGLGVSRVVEIDASSGPLFGDITAQVKEESFLKQKEVVLTFDDGPMPWVTSSILDTLDKFCTKATFFSVGKMAIAYPATLRKVVERGHTLGGHTWSHPLNLKRLGHEAAMAEIEKGIAAISLASGGKAAPFFRFPGLSDNSRMLAALQRRGIASFSVDVVSDDSYISNPAKLIATTLSRVEARKGGILLFHDIKPATAKALPTILGELKKRGYRVVHMLATANVKPLAQFTDELQPVLAKKDPPQGQAAAKAAMLPFFGAIGPERVERASGGTPEPALRGVKVDMVAPAPRDRSTTAKASDKTEPGKSPNGATASPKSSSDNGAGGQKTNGKANQVREHALRKTDDGLGETVHFRGDATGDTWSAQIRRERLNRTLYD